MNATNDEVTDDELVQRFTTVHCRFQVMCDCCGLVEAYPKKNAAIKAMIDHVDQHELSETLKFSVYDVMAKGGGKNVYAGRIYGGVRSHGVWPGM